MFDEPGETPPDHSFSPADRAKAKTDEFRMHAELAAVFEGVRKFEAQILPGFDPELSRELQKSFAKLERAKSPDSPVLPPASSDDAANILRLPASRNITTNDYHVYRRPGEVFVIRWLQGPEVESFYERLQAHFDAALGAFRQEERSAQEWRKDPATLEYLAALDSTEIDMAERYLRKPIRQHKLFVLSTQTADEINIAYLTEYIMGIPSPDLVGPVSAPPAEPSERDLAWFYKLFCLRGIDGDLERMCFFLYLQKTEDSMEIDP
jgi:hypothetical protein